jgi:hypothetical protein
VKFILSRILELTLLAQLLTELAKRKEIEDNFEIWLSCDEEGNVFLPMLEKPEFGLVVETDVKRIIFFPSHR